MKKFITLSLSIFLLTTISPSQNIEINKNTTNIIKEDFNSSENSFPILTTIDNYFIVDNGDYLLSRNNTESEYAILANTDAFVSDFRLRASIRLGPSSDRRSSAGVIIKAQQNENGAIIIEINRRNEYRIKELQFDQTYKFLSGKMSDKGWVKSSLIKGEDEYNSMEIRCEKNVYDLYINNRFLTNFFIPNFKDGKMGIFVSQNSKSRIAYYYLDAIETSAVNIVEEQQSDKNLIDLTNKISELESEISSLENNNERLELDIKKIKMQESSDLNTEDFEKINSDNESLNLKISQLKVYLESANNQNTSLRLENTKIEKENSTLKTSNENLTADLNKVKEDNDKVTIKFEEGEKLIKEFTDSKSNLNTKISGIENENSVLKNNLSKSKNNLKDIENKNSELTTEIGSLKKSITSLKSKIDKLNSDIENEKTSSSDKFIKVEKNLNSTISTLVKEKKRIEINLNSEILSLKNTTDKLNKNNYDKTNEITKLNVKISSLQKKLNSINKNTDISKKLKETVDALEQELKKKELDTATLMEKINKLNSDISILQKNNKNLISSIELKNEEASDMQLTIKDKENTIEKMKEVFVYKGFDENGVDSEKVKATSTNIVKPKVITKKDEIYSVQIAVYGNKVNIAQFSGLSDVFYVESEYGTFMYMSGQFNDPNKASSHKNDLIKKGYTDAFVLILSK